ncbi:MAG: hypothetical protein RIQ56_281 [Candidatus Parcubacteria bacterium]
MFVLGIREFRMALKFDNDIQESWTVEVIIVEPQIFPLILGWLRYDKEQVGDSLSESRYLVASYPNVFQ